MDTKNNQREPTDSGAEPVENRLARLLGLLEEVTTNEASHILSWCRACERSLSLEAMLTTDSLVSDALWARIEPLFPPPKPRRFRFPGRKPKDRRKVLTGIIFVLKTGIPWEELPQEMGCGCGMTCLTYLKAWQRAGVWHHVHEALLAELQEADRIDWSRAAVDGRVG